MDQKIQGMDGLTMAFMELIILGQKAREHAQFKDALLSFQTAANVAVTMHQLGSGLEPGHHSLADPVWGDADAEDDGTPEDYIEGD